MLMMVNKSLRGPGDGGDDGGRGRGRGSGSDTYTASGTIDRWSSGDRGVTWLPGRVSGLYDGEDVKIHMFKINISTLLIKFDHR